jgi:alpha-glucan phosphorylase
MENGIVDKIQIIPMNLIGSDDEKKEYEYEATVELTTGGNYGYTFRVMPKNEMLLDPANLDLVKWITK